MLSRKETITIRRKIFIAAFSGILLILCAVLLNISTVKNVFYTQKAVSQRASGIDIRPCRGDIYDKNMIPFTNTHSNKFILNSNGISLYDGKSDKNNAYVFEMPSRYADTSVMHHILGYLNADYSGASGIEKIFNKELSTNKKIRLELINTAAGNPTYNGMYKIKNADYMSDSNIKLTVDRRIQNIVEKNMDKYIKSGAVVVLDVSSFDILASASRPDFDVNNIKSAVLSLNSPLVNRAFSAYNAGSIFKIITACGAIENGIYNLNSEFDCLGKISCGGKDFLCNGTHGNINLKTGFAKSCNSVFYNVGLKCGGKILCDTAQKFMLGSTVTNIPQFEARGNVPVRGVYTDMESVNLSIGQGELLITPVQAANIACIIANRGVWKSINLADSIVDKKGAVIKNLRKNNEGRAIPVSCADAVADMMREAVLEGTAQSAQNGIIAIAGKTGTAQTGWYNDTTDELNVHGWFIGYFPYENPKYAMAVLCEDGQSGAASCIPAFKDIALEIMCKG